MAHKRFLRLWALAGAFLLFASCDGAGSGDNGCNPDVGEIRFEIGIGSLCGDPQLQSVTHADFSAEFEDGDEIGVFAVAHGQSLSATASGNYINNAKLTYDGGSWRASENLWWPGITSLDFYAYYPYDAVAADPTAIVFNVLADQSALSGYGASDLLTAKSAGPASSPTSGWAKGSTVTLTFAHALAMVQVSVPSPGKGFGPSEDLKVTLRGVSSGATVDLGAIDATTPGSEISIPVAGNNATAIAMHRVERPGDANYETSYTYRALVPAQDVPGGYSFLMSQLYELYEASGSSTLTAGRAETFTRTLPLTLLHTVFVPAGTFLMGSSDGTGLPDGSGLNTTPKEPNRDYDETQHWVKLTKGFNMSKYPVTFAQYDAFCEAESISKPSDNGWGRGDRPVINVSWNDAVAYCTWLSGQTGQTWTLPTEAQWEYACRGGQTESLPFGIEDGKKLTYDMANFDTHYLYDMAQNGQYYDAAGTGYVGSTTAVGSYPYKNGYGLYDMHGNVWEWCRDNYANYPTGTTEANPVVDPEGSGNYRVLRGGGWSDYAQYCRSAYRNNYIPDGAYNFVGFRVVFVP